MIETVKKILGLGKKNTGIKLIVSCERLEKRVALLENNRLEEYTTERESDRNIVGAIYKGKVRNIEQGIKAMFVDIGFEKNAFLQFWDAIPAALDSGVEAVSREVGKKKGQKITHKDVPEDLPGGFRHPGAGKEGADRQQGTAHYDRREPRGPLSRAHAVQRPMRDIKED